jgi:hypothetical protein
MGAVDHLTAPFFLCRYVHFFVTAPLLFEATAHFSFIENW